MDVSCERCKAQYVVDDGLVDETGLAVRCSKCGYLFRVTRPPRGWRLRRASGEVFPLPDLSMLQRWIVEGRVAREDEVARDEESWTRAGEMKDLEPFFVVVEQARSAAAAAAAAARKQPAAGPVEPEEPSFAPPQRRAFGRESEPMVGGPEERTPSETWEVPAAGGGARSNEPAWAGAVEAGPVVRAADGGRRRPRSQRRGARLPWLLAILVVVAACAVAAYLVNPAWLGLDGLSSLLRGAAPVTVPPAGEPPLAAVPAPGATSAPAAESAPAPQPSPEPTPPVAAAATPTPTPLAAAATPTPPPPAAAAARAVPTPPPASSAESEPAVATPPASPKPPATAPEATPAPVVAQGPVATATPAPRPAPAPSSAPAAPHTGASAAAPARAAEPHGVKALLASARRLRERGRSEAALDTYGRAVQLEPANADALAGRGLCYLDLSRYPLAEESFRAALEANGEHAAALMGLAETYRYEGRRADAVTYYKRYVAAHPEGEDAAAARNAIKALEESP